MDFKVRYTEAQEEFRREVKSFLDETIPEVLRHRSDAFHEPLEIYLEQRKLGRALGSRGWLFPTAPKQYGGGGLDLDSTLVIMEELDRLGLQLPPYYDSGGVLGSVAILVWGTEEQKRKFLPPIYSGEARTWQLLTEPSGGSDLAGVKSLAVQDGDEWVINGQKVFVGSEHGADQHWTIVRTSADAPRHQNLGWFMIPGDAKGLTIQPMRLIGSMDKNTVFFDNVRLPAVNLVGGPNNGWKVATTHLELEHGFRPDRIFGNVGQQQFQRLLAYCKDAKTSNGARLLDDPFRRDLMAQAYIKREIHRLWQLRNFWLSGTGGQSYEGAQGYYWQKVTGMWMNRIMADVVGPTGLVWGAGVGAGGGAVGRASTGGISGSHGGGTIDIQRVVMSRRLGIGRAEVESGAKLS
jgi:alkylation response protein AidB-like acyl-CoA dehydrogenase